MCVCVCVCVCVCARVCMCVSVASAIVKRPVLPLYVEDERCPFFFTTIITGGGGGGGGCAVVVAFSLLAGLFGECSIVHSPSALFFFFLIGD